MQTFYLRDLFWLAVASALIVVIIMNHHKYQTREKNLRDQLSEAKAANVAGIEKIKSELALSKQKFMIVERTNKSLKSIIRDVNNRVQEE